MVTVVFKPNRAGIGAVALRSDDVAALVTRKAVAVAGASSTGDLTYEVRTDVGRNRVRAAVIAAGPRTNAHEIAHHVLARTMDVARSVR
jgi:hypothetical protein